MEPNVEKELAAGNRLLQEGDLKGALSRFNKAVKLDPNCAEAYFGIAEASVGIPKVSIDQILNAYRKAIELDSKNPYYYSAYGSFCLENGLYKEAEEAYTRAAHLDPDNAIYYLSELSVEFYRNAISKMDEEASNQEYDTILKKSLEYFLKALNLTREEAMRLLSQ
ncbi:MAG: tetratricopeptide repeat protein [Thermoplasmata archaeon]|nr:tetratricopeptide repeat protein [Thermoplasmata archaeon]